MRAGLIGMGELVRDNYERISQLFDEGKAFTGLSTGYHQLDDLTSGLQPSDIDRHRGAAFGRQNRVRAESRRERWLATTLPVAIFSLEMSKESLLMRLLSDHARIDAHKFRTGHLPRDDRAKITDTLNFLAEVPLWIDDAGGTTVLEMGAKCRRMARDKGLVAHPGRLLAARLRARPIQFTQ